MERELALAETRNEKWPAFQDVGTAFAKARRHEETLRVLGPAQAAWSEPDQCERKPAGF